MIFQEIQNSLANLISLHNMCIKFLTKNVWLGAEDNLSLQKRKKI